MDQEQAEKTLKALIDTAVQRGIFVSSEAVATTAEALRVLVYEMKAAQHELKELKKK